MLALIFFLSWSCLNNVFVHFDCYLELVIKQTLDWFHSQMHFENHEVAYIFKIVFVPLIVI